MFEIFGSDLEIEKDFLDSTDKDKSSKPLPSSTPSSRATGKQAKTTEVQQKSSTLNDDSYRIPRIPRSQPPRKTIRLSTTKTIIAEDKRR